MLVPPASVRSVEWRDFSRRQSVVTWSPRERGARSALSYPRLNAQEDHSRQGAPERYAAHIATRRPEGPAQRAPINQDPPSVIDRFAPPPHSPPRLSRSVSSAARPRIKLAASLRSTVPSLP